MTDPLVPAAHLPVAPLPAAPLPGTTTLSPAVMAAPPGRIGRSLTEFWSASRQPASSGTLLACATVGVVGAALLVGHRLGLGAALVGLAVWAAAAPVLVRRRAVGDLVTAGLSIALVAVVAIRDASWVAALCLLTAALVGAVAATSARSAPAVVLSALSWAAGAFRTVPWVTGGAATLVGSRRGRVLAALRSVAVTVVLLVVFGMLFASADTVFASYVPRVDLGLLPGQVVVGVLVALVAATLADLAVAPPGWSDAELPPGRPAPRGEWLLPVLALDALVLAFVLVQVGALLGGHRHVLETSGLTYAEYARQGFAQLVVVTALTLVVVAVAARRAPRASARDRLISRVALGVLCVATLGVVASALRRMSLYMDAFGLTRLRLFVVVVEVVLAVVLVLVLVAGVRWRGGWLPRVVVQVVAVAMLGLALVNPDALIVRYNAAAERDASLVVGLDVGYLQGLSADAVPEIARLEEPLRSCVLERVVVEASPGVADWNLGRARAAQVLGSTDLTAGTACADDAITRP
ncbi:MAG TPA: DUF4173 domain-containing protein [Cellulomonas sp.]|uniref:DUF4153 domain-containing protein n=1 Tax=Cellulomonas sp. TaxID=40001 RepID=UPI002E2FCB58|nr:DUF4173 domain-containing protein [Cellulomonas sp.]HEX5334043.1 DUF4173 domain-containing protein [Cellulomonas sp.]